MSQAEEGAQAHRPAETSDNPEWAGLAGRKPRAGGGEGEGVLSLASSASSFQAGTGRELKVLCGLEKIITVQGRDQVATRVTPTVIDVESGRRLTGRDRAMLDAPDFLAIDRIVLRAGLPLLNQDLDWPVIVPISFYTVSRTRARIKLFKSLGLNSEKTQNALISEIVGVDKGTPQSRLTDSVSLIRPYCCAVFVEALTPGTVRHMANSRIAGVSLDCRDLRHSEEVMTASLGDFGEAGASVARTVMARGLPSEAMIDVAQSVGVTHVSLRREAADSWVGDSQDDQREAA